jgi:hypothetical protein
MGMHEPEKRKQMSQLSLDNKWMLISQHQAQEQSKVEREMALFSTCNGTRFHGKSHVLSAHLLCGGAPSSSSSSIYTGKET